MVSLGEQFSVGDQTKESRYTFWKNAYQTCPVCNGKKINKTSHSAGCRHNGDGYGTDVFECSDCTWCTSFQYDDAAEVYYYETTEFRKRWEDERTPKIYRDITAADKLKYHKLFQQKRITKDMIASCLSEELIKQDQVDAFLKEF